MVDSNSDIEEEIFEEESSDNGDRWVIYDYDADVLMHRLYHSYEAADGDATQLHDVVVLKLQVPISQN